MPLPIQTLKWNPKDPDPELEAYLRTPATDPAAERVAAETIAAVRAGGDAALVRLAAQYDGVSLSPETLAVPKAERTAALDAATPEFKRILAETIRRIAAFGKAGMRQDWSIASARGGILGEQFTPIDRVGVYIPGGTAPLVSTALMTLVLAKVAGVPEIVACTPARRADGAIDPHLLCAIETAGATEVYRIGGTQAIAALAYGTETIRPVRKIVGPGGPYVAAAKKLVYGQVDLDMVAGPSEIAILADDTANPAHIAADFMSQLEHGSGRERALLATPSAFLLKNVQAEIDRQVETLSRAAYVRKAAAGARFVLAETLDAAADVVNRFAPEHLEIQTREPRLWLRKIKNAGAIFVGAWTPESAGDFAAGPSHVLPTGGTAACFSGLTVDSFRKRSSIIAYTRADLLEALPIIETFAATEGLDAHARSAAIRFDAPPAP